jgi:hypothetical protein
MNEIVFIEKSGDYKREAKRFIKGCVKSKLFTSPENKIEFRIEKGEFDKKAKMGIVVLTTACPVSGMKADYVVNAATRVYNKIDATMFESLVGQYARMKTPLTLTITE